MSQACHRWRGGRKGSALGCKGNKSLATDSTSNASMALTTDCWSNFNGNTGLLAATGHILNSITDSRASVNLECVPLGLESYIDELNLPIITPATDCAICWGSTYMMICDIVSTHGRAAVDRLMENQCLDPYEDDEIRSLKSVKNFSQPYYELTKKVCAKDAIRSLVLAGGKLLLAKIEGLCNESHTRMKQFGNMLLTEARKQFAPSFADKTLRISSSLEPWFAFVELTASTEEWRSTVGRLIEINCAYLSLSFIVIPTSAA
ncbi:hypothetical protein Aduo_009669 [Ancylostoma duodenale]